MNRVPLISICIPHYARHKHLIACIESIRRQTFNDYEICISDDTPPSPEPNPVEQYLKRSGLQHSYIQNSTPLRYDANIRQAIDMSSGRFVLLFGNDDTLSTEDSLKTLADLLESSSEIGAAVCNYEEQATGKRYQRCRSTRIVAGGAKTACDNFRDFAFVSGVVLRGNLCRSVSSAIADGSEMYQMYLMAACVGSGGALLQIEDYLVTKDIQLEGEKVASVHDHNPSDAKWLVRTRPMAHILRAVSAGLNTAPACEAKKVSLGKAAIHLHLFTYPFWGVEFRRSKPFSYALGVMLGTRPDITCRGIELRLRDLAAVWLACATMSPLALLTPLRLYDRISGLLYSIAKR